MNQMNLTKSSKCNAAISWPQATSFKHYFSLPDSLIYYITKNPSTPKCYLKLAKCCKYFFEKNPILIVQRFIDEDVKQLCSNNSAQCSNSNGKRCCVKADISKLTNAKIWITDLFGKHKNIETTNFTALLCSKIYRCENATLSFYYSKMVLKDFKLYAAKFQKFYLFQTKIIDADGNAVMLDKIIESIPNVHTFSYHDINPTAYISTKKNILKLKNLENIQYLSLSYIPEGFNVQDLANFITNHRNTRFCLEFRSNISQDYAKHIKQLVDIVIETNIPKCLIRY